jgi:hypothetical protein
MTFKSFFSSKTSASKYGQERKTGTKKTLISCSRRKGIEGGERERNDRWGAGAKALKR